MANVNDPNGFTPAYHMSGGTIRPSEFAIASGTTGAIFSGDVVNLASGLVIQGTATGTVRVNGASQTGNQVALDGFTASRANVFKAGDYIQINSYVYMVTEDVSADGSGEANVKIEPALRQGIETINNDTTVVYLNTTTIMRLDSNEFSWDTDHVSKYGISFACSEAL